MQDQFGNGLDHCRPADEIPATLVMMLGVERRKLEPVVDVSVGGWIAPRLGPFGGWAALPDHALRPPTGVHCGCPGHGDGHELWSDGAFHAHDPGTVVLVCAGSGVMLLGLTAS
jgi:hypothetical protein